MLNAGVRGLPAEATSTVPDVPSAADQTAMEAASSTTTYVTPGRAKFHPGVAKVWAHITVSGGTYTLRESTNVSGINKDGTGLVTITFTTALASAFFAAIVTALHSSSPRVGRVVAQTTTTVQLQFNDGAFNAADPEALSVAIFGDFS